MVAPRRTGNSAYQREPSGCCEHPLRHLIHRVAHHLLAALGTIAAADAREQQPQEIVDLGGGRDRGARIARGVLLPDRDGRRDAGDLIHIRLFHALQKLPRVRRQRFHVAPLAFGVHGVEDQRRLAGAGDTGDHRQLIVRNRERDVLEIVDSRATDEYGFFQGMCFGRAYIDYLKKTFWPRMNAVERKSYSRAFAFIAASEK